MKKIFTMSNIIKFAPVVIAAAAAVSQAIGEIKEADKIDDMERRISELEGNTDEEEA